MVLHKVCEIFKSPPWRKGRLENLLLSLLFCVSTAGVVFHVKMNLNVPTFHMDGAFQTASSLLRLQAGEVIGRDFFPYLGTGVVLALYPFFKLLGGNLMASVQAASLLCILAAAFMFGSMSSIFFRDKILSRFFLFFSGFLLLFLLANSLKPFMECYWFNDFVVPGNSLRLIRNLIVYVGVWGAFLTLQSPLRTVHKAFLLGGLAGLSFLWSNDFGIPTTLAIFIISATWFYINTKEQWFRLSLLTLLVFLAAIFSIGMLVTWGNFISLLRYNFMDVRNDQFWYFFPYVSSEKFLRFTHLFTKILFRIEFPAALFILIGVSYMKTKKPEYLFSIATGLVCFSTTVILCVGGHFNSEYLNFCFHWAYVALFSLLCGRLLAGRASNQSKFLIVAAALACWVGITSAGDYRSLVKSNAMNPEKIHVPELGGWLGNDYKEYIEFIRANKNSTAMEEYWGIWSAVAGRFDNPKVDSVIHARGSVEAQFVGKVRQFPDFYVSARNVPSSLFMEESGLRNEAPAMKNVLRSFSLNTPETFVKVWGLDFQLWQISVSYRIYAILLRHYVPVFASPEVVVWKFNGDTNDKEFPIVSSSISQTSFTIHADEAGYYEVELDVDFDFSSRSILLVKSNMAAFLDSRRPLNPRDTHHVFPVYFDGVNREFPMSSTPDGKPIRITSCKVRKIPLKDERIFPNLNALRPVLKEVFTPSP